MTLTQMRCADCGGKNVEGERTYTIKDGEQRTMYHGASCGCSFSETKQTPLAHLKTPIAVIVQVLSALTEGVGINAATRLYGVSKNSIYRWPERLSGVCIGIPNALFATTAARRCVSRVSSHPRINFLLVY